MAKNRIDHPQGGFTLIEISIVLVIIGLIVGGVLAGQDLIRAARTRSQLGQIEQYQAAINTFSVKYSQLPGDMPAAKAAIFGMTARNGTVGNGDGDGNIESCMEGWSIVAAGCEVVLFWSDLSSAGLIEGSFTTATDAFTQVNPGQQSTVFPKAKIADNVFITVWTSHATPINFSTNMLAIGAIQSTASSGFYSNGNGITPNQAFAIDSKIDDGSPSSAGNVWAYTAGFALNTLTVGATACVSLPVAYNTSPTYGDMPLCNLNIKF